LTLRAAPFTAGREAGPTRPRKEARNPGGHGVRPTGMAIGRDGAFYVSENGFGFGPGQGQIDEITIH
jgi:glucose/arabinose dehydrogenase